MRSNRTTLLILILIKQTNKKNIKKRKPYKVFVSYFVSTLPYVRGLSVLNLICLKLYCRWTAKTKPLYDGTLYCVMRFGLNFWSHSQRGIQNLSHSLCIWQNLTEWDDADFALNRMAGDIVVRFYSHTLLRICALHWPRQLNVPTHIG